MGYKQIFNPLTGNFDSVLDTDSPDFTGTPTAPTASYGTNTTQLATTSFVGAAVTGASLSKLLRITPFLSSGTYTKGADVQYVLVMVQGGGGAGGTGNSAAGAGGSGGGAGGYSEKLIQSASLGATETVTVGAALGTSSFGAHCSATGGTNGAASGGAGGTGGLGSGGDINLRGQGGGAGSNALAGGNGGTSPRFGGGAPADASGAGTAAQANSGSGGSGGYNSTGGAGATGVVYVYEYGY